MLREDVIIENTMIRNERLLKKAEELKPDLCEKIYMQEGRWEPLKRGCSLRFDFGTHLTGYASFSLGYSGSHPDAPLLLRIRFAERLIEFDEDPKGYKGWVCGGWIQEEYVHVDVLPCRLELPRRYAFRYVEVQVMEISDKFDLTVEKAEVRAVSSAKDEDLKRYDTSDAELGKIDEIGVRTLHDCMQLVFEDGPKRDRRLWLGDLRIQALSDYYSYSDLDLVRRCLYLFAGSTMDDGRICGGLFIEPEVEGDDVVMFDYSLLFIPALLDYYEYSKDEETLRDLWPAAKKQIELSLGYFDEKGLVKDSDVMGWCFLDWNLDLNKQAGAQGVYIYSLKAGKRICEILGDKEELSFIEKEIEEKTAAALEYLYDEESGLFVSGEGRQISWASQVWMTLCGADKNGESLINAESAKALSMVTPYMYHHYVQALIDTGMKEKALEVINLYWGGMAKLGADTFWEMYDPDDPDASPYGGSIINSYCHAWSCGPVYFLRKYFRGPEK